MNRQLIIRQAPKPLEVAPGQTILSTALAAGVPYPHSCTKGRCGACISRLLEGQVELLPHSRFALSQEDRDRGLVLACRSLPLTDVTVAWGAEDALEAVPLEATVLARHEIAPGIVRLVVATTGDVQFRAGQFFSVSFAGCPSRNYSPANQPQQHRIEFHIRIVPGGTVGRFVSEHLKPGDKVDLTGPFGEAYLREDAVEPLVAAAAGTGLAPIKSIVERALELNPERRISIFVSAQRSSALYLDSYFGQLSQSYPNVSYRPTLTRQGARPSRLPQLLIAEGYSFAGHHVHIAGPAEFVEATQAAMLSLGAAEASTFADPFTFEAPRS